MEVLSAKVTKDRGKQGKETQNADLKACFQALVQSDIK